MKNLFLSFIAVSTIFTSYSFANEDVNLTNGLIAHYEFEDNANNSSGNYYNGVVHGHEIYTNGVYGKGIKLDNYLDLVEFDSTILNGQTDTTVSLWVAMKDYKRQSGIISAVTNSGANNYLMFYNSSNTLTFETLGTEYTGPNKIQDNLFHLLSITTTSNNIKVYIDNELNEEFNTTIQPFVIDSSIWLGNDQDSLNGSWDSAQQLYGIVDDLRFYNRALNESEIQKLYQIGSSYIISTTTLQYADRILDSHYSGANPEFTSFYGGDLESGPKLVPLSYAIDGNESTAVSLPTGSYITVGFSQISIIDAPNQDDLYIVEGGAGGEDAKIYVSSDFVNFTYLGLAQDDVTTSFDLEDINFTQPVVAVKIVGQDNGGSWPGFDLYEVKGLAGSIIKNDTQCKEIVQIYAKSPNTNKWITFSNPCDIPVEWETTIQKPEENLLVDCNISVIPNITQVKIDNLTTGWHLLGTASYLNDTSIFNNTITVWKYDNGWQAYSPNSTLQSIIDNSNTIQRLEDIEADRGFWINK